MDNKKEVENAANYAKSSNRLENNNLTMEEVDEIIKGIEQQQTDDSFLYSLYQYLNQNNGEKQHVKNRK